MSSRECHLGNRLQTVFNFVTGRSGAVSVRARSQSHEDVVRLVIKSKYTFEEPSQK